MQSDSLPRSNYHNNNKTHSNSNIAHLLQHPHSSRSSSSMASGHSKLQSTIRKAATTSLHLAGSLVATH